MEIRENNEQEATALSRDLRPAQNRRVSKTKSEFEYEF